MYHAVLPTSDSLANPLILLEKDSTVQLVYFLDWRENFTVRIVIVKTLLRLRPWIGDTEV